jgi:very-short-patch-repair endonuclease
MPKQITNKQWNVERIKVHRDKYECLDEYVSAKTKLRFKCKNTNHDIFLQTPNKHLTGQGCIECSGLKKKHIKWLIELASKKGGTCMSKKYVNISTNYRWKCGDCDYEWQASAANVSKGTWCPICANKEQGLYHKKNISWLNNLGKINNGSCHATEYKNITTKYCWQCDQGHTWFATANNINSGKWCPYCKGKYKTIEDLKQLATTKGGKCLSIKYIMNNSKYLWECSEKHQWTACSNNIQQGKWCPRCSKISNSKGVQKIEQILDSKNIFYHREYGFDDCKKIRQLKFDFYLPDYSLLIEFDGQQHFKAINFFGGDSTFKEYKERDKIKDDYCVKQNIRLIRIPYNEINSIHTIIENAI